MIPSIPVGPFAGTYNGKPLPESGLNAWDLSDQQKTFLKNDNVRHVLITSVQSPEVAAKWNNNAQAYVEGIGLGIPNNNSSDPSATVLCHMPSLMPVQVALFLCGRAP
jgi:beta-glucosidase